MKSKKWIFAFLAVFTLGELARAHSSFPLPGQQMEKGSVPLDAQREKHALQIFLALVEKAIALRPRRCLPTSTGLPRPRANSRE